MATVNIIIFATIVCFAHGMNPRILQCAEKLSLQFSSDNQDRAYTKAPNCVLACAFREFSEKEEKNAYDGMIASMDYIYEMGTDSHLYPHETLLDKINQCNAKGLNECDFVTCVDVFKAPFKGFFF